MSINNTVLNIQYTYTVPTLAKAIEQTKNKIDPANIEKIAQGSINDVYNKYSEYFRKTDGIYTRIKTELLAQLNSILDNSALNIKNLDTDAFYSNAQTFGTYRIDRDHCREGFMAYRFYLKEIATKIIAIDNYITEGQTMLNKLANVSGSSEQVNNLAHEYITQLEIYDKFIYEELKEFLTYHKFNEDTKQWDTITLDVFTEKSYEYSQLNQYATYNTLGKYRWNGKQWIDSKSGSTKMPYMESKLQNLRSLKVDTTKSDNPKSCMQLTSFNSLTLFDRLRYIRYYYKLMFSQSETSVDRANSRFPDENDTGYPCMPDVPSTDAKKATQSLGALELFYVGYLINRDGPVNALSSFFEVKVEALRNNVSLSSKKIEALNIYLDFINRGLDELNKRSGAQPYKGSIIALTYLCGQNMYNLFETNDGNKYLVLPTLASNATDKYFLVKADDVGKDWLLGTGNEDTKLSIEKNTKNLWYIKDITHEKTYPGANKIDAFKLPTQIECTEVSPSSVKQYDDALNILLETKSDNNVLGSWTDAFSRKTQFINTAIDTVNTDVTLDRSKIDTFDSLTSTFRSRAQDTYQNILSNVR